MWCPLRATGLDNGIIFNLLVWCTVAQSPLVHRMLQGVEHTDPTGWSNSHLSIGDKFVIAVRRTARLCIRCSLFSFNDSFSHLCGGGSATFILFKDTESVKVWFSTMYTHNVLFWEQLTHVSVIFQYCQHDTVV